MWILKILLIKFIKLSTGHIREWSDAPGFTIIKSFGNVRLIFFNSKIVGKALTSTFGIFNFKSLLTKVLNIYVSGKKYLFVE